MVETGKFADLRRWLDGIEPEERRGEVAVTIAARAALRWVPLLRSSLEVPQEQQIRHLSLVLLPALRAVASPWVISRFPTRRNELRQSIQESDAFAFRYKAPSPAAYAITAASFAVALKTEGVGEDALDVAVAAVVSTAETDAEAHIEDAKRIAAGSSAADLSSAPLWLNGTPPWATGAWRELKALLLADSEDWRVWTRWYEARLAGDYSGPPIEALEVARAKIDEKVWYQGPRAVNAEIARLIELHTPKPTAAPDPELGSALAVTTAN